VGGQHHDGPSHQLHWTDDMGIIVSERIRTAQRVSPRERLDRLAVVTADSRTETLQFLAGYDPGTFDAVLNAVEPCDEDGAPDVAEDSVLFCALNAGKRSGSFSAMGSAGSTFATTATTWLMAVSRSSTPTLA
jgi:hypothetical protein